MHLGRITTGRERPDAVDVHRPPMVVFLGGKCASAQARATGQAGNGAGEDLDRPGHDPGRDVAVATPRSEASGTEWSAPLRLPA